MDVSQIPAELRQMAENLGVDVEALAAQLPGGGQQAATGKPAAPAAAAAAMPGAISPIPGTPAAAVQTTPGGAQVAEGVTAREAESPEDTLRRELAVAQQELQQTRANFQAVQEARVVGNAGLSGPVVDTPPNLGGIEPGIRFAVRNGLIAAEDLETKLGPIIVDLFKKDLGGAI